MASMTTFPRGVLTGHPGVSWVFGPILEFQRLSESRPALSTNRPPGGPAYSAEPDQEPAELDDAQWIDRVQQGDEEAALFLIRRLFPTIIRSVRRHRPKRTSEEDLTQAIYLKVFKKLGQFSGRVPLEHWVSKIAINTCLNYLRHEVVRPELRMSDLSEEEEIVVQQLAASADDELPGDGQYAARELVGRLMQCLKPDQRLVVTMLHLEERSVAEISQLTGWSESGVKLKAFRARRRMRKLADTLIQDERALA